MENSIFLILNHFFSLILVKSTFFTGSGAEIFFIAFAIVLVIYLIILRKKTKLYKRAYVQQQTSARVIDIYKKPSTQYNHISGGFIKSPAKTDENNEHLEEIKKLKQSIVGYKKKTDEMHLQVIRLKNEKIQLQQNIEQILATTKEEFEKIQDDNILQLKDEIMILDHHLSDSRAMLEDFVEKNKMLSEEFQKTLDREKNLEQENNKLIAEIDSIKVRCRETEAEKSRLKLFIEQNNFQQNGHTDKETSKLREQLQICKDQIAALENARVMFENQMESIFTKYKNAFKNT